MLKKISSKNLYKDKINNKRTKNKKNINKKKRNKKKAGSRSREKSLAAKKIQANIRGKLTRKNLNIMLERFSLKSKSKSKSKSPEKCGICLENVNESEQSTMCCKSNHPYHAKCIDELLSNEHFNCPSCRQRLDFKVKLKHDVKTKAKIIADKVLKKYSIQQLEYFRIIISGFSDEFRGNFDSEFIIKCDYALRFIRNMIDLHNRPEEIEKLLDQEEGFKKTTDYINKSYDTIIDTIEIINEFMEAEEQEQE